MNIVVSYNKDAKKTASVFRDFWKANKAESITCYGTSWSVKISGDDYWFISKEAFEGWTLGKTYMFLDDARFFHSGKPCGIINA